VAPDRKWWTAYSEHAVSEDIPASPDEAREYYVDLRNTTAVHPLVVSVTPTSAEATDDGVAQTYRVRDRIPLGLVTMPITYTATVRTAGDGVVHTEARQFPAVRLVGVVTFEAIAASTLLTERLVIAAPRLLAGFTARAAVEAHREMLAGIRAHFANR
jgi:hypothetical protein